MNKVSYVELDILSVFCTAENDRIAIQLVKDFLQQNRYEDFDVTGSVKCLHYPCYQVAIYKI